MSEVNPFKWQLLEAAAEHLAELSMRLGKPVESIEKIEFHWHYRFDPPDVITCSKVYPDAMMQRRARAILEGWTGV